jgi:hypothetical protein
MLAVLIKPLMAVLVPMLKMYIAKLASEKFAHWALMEVAEAIVHSTETKEDDKWLKSIRNTIEGKPVDAI